MGLVWAGLSLYIAITREYLHPKEGSLPKAMEEVQRLATGTEGTGNIAVFVFESNQMSCELLSRALEESCYGVTVSGADVSSTADAISMLAKSDVVVISPTLRDGPLSGFTLLRRLSRAHPRLRCVVLLDKCERDLVIEAFPSGAVGVCQRDQPYEMLCKSVWSGYSGQIWASTRVT